MVCYFASLHISSPFMQTNISPGICQMSTEKQNLPLLRTTAKYIDIFMTLIVACLTIY